MHKRLSVIFYVLLTVHLEYNRVKKNQLDAQIILIIFRQPLHVSDYLGSSSVGRLRLKCDSTRAETRFRLSAKRTSPFKSAGGRQFSRLLAAEVCASAVVMLDTLCSEVV